MERGINLKDFHHANNKMCILSKKITTKSTELPALWDRLINGNINDL